MAGGPSAVLEPLDPCSPNHAAERSQPADPVEQAWKQRCPGGCQWMRLQEEAHGSLQRDVLAKSNTNPLPPQQSPRNKSAFLTKSRGPLMCKQVAATPKPRDHMPATCCQKMINSQTRHRQHRAGSNGTYPSPKLRRHPRSTSSSGQTHLPLASGRRRSQHPDEASGKGVAKGACMLLFMLRSGFDHSQPLSNIRL